MKKIHFYNTYEISVPIWNWLFPHLKENGFICKGIISGSKYRENKQSELFSDLVSLRFNNNILKGKFWDHLFYLILAPLYILRQSKKDLNIFYTQPPFALPLLTLFSRLKRMPYVVHVMDYHPVFIRQSENWLSSVVFRVLNSLYTYSISRAEKVVVIGRCAHKMLVLLGVHQELISVIPNLSSIEPTNYKEPKLHLELRKEYLIDQEYVLLYAGNMGHAHLFRTLLHVAKHFSNKVHFVFVGHGVRRQEIQKYIDKNKPDNISLLPYLSSDVFEKVVELSHFHFMSLNKSFTGVMVPSKFYTSLANGKIVIFEGDEGCEVAQVIKENGIGSVIECSSYKSMISAISGFISNKERVLELSKLSYELYMKEFHSTEYVKHYYRVIGDIQFG